MVFKIKLKLTNPYLREPLSHFLCFITHYSTNSTLILSNQQTTFNVNSWFSQTSITLFSLPLVIFNVNSWFIRTLIALFSFPIVLFIWTVIGYMPWTVMGLPTIAYNIMLFSTLERHNKPMQSRFKSLIRSRKNADNPNKQVFCICVNKETIWATLVLWKVI